MNGVKRYFTLALSIAASCLCIQPVIAQPPDIGPIIEISAKIFEFRYDTETQFGIFYQFNSTDSALQNSDVFLHGTESLLTDAPIPALDVSGSFADLSYGSIDFNVKAALDEGWGTVISNPTLITANGKPASIQSGEQIPYTTVKFTGSKSKLTLQEKPTGIKLVVTPYILPGDTTNNILMNLEIESNDVVRFEVFDRGEGERFELPVVSRRNVQTAVIIPSGQRLYIGGLYSRNTGDITRKIPIVGDLPVIGFFLRGFNKKRGTAETMFQITPTIRKPGLGIQTHLSGFDQVLGPDDTLQAIIQQQESPISPMPEETMVKPQNIVPELPQEIIESASKSKQAKLNAAKHGEVKPTATPFRANRRSGKAHLRRP
ncbi:MAG: type II and III secretion system protein [Candidatus Hinthialibacter antarcticus]|nr:type II and III secretion system protein [Candidatus Hinthialibacter antarcticus]